MEQTADAHGAGSSPLTRGKLRRLGRCRTRCGLIPAHAGKTGQENARGNWRKAHPRSRGENRVPAVAAIAGPGSSPLTRGKPKAPTQMIRTWRLIPAHAGKTSASRSRDPCLRAHPRSRGENVHEADYCVLEVGSSPLTRGKHFLTCAFIAQIDQILESLELCASSESYSLRDAYATDAPQDRVRSIGLVPRSSRGASSA